MAHSHILHWEATTLGSTLHSCLYTFPWGTTSWQDINISFHCLYVPPAPSPAQNLTVTSNSSYIFITWAAPENPNGVVNYTVIVRERNLLTNATADIESVVTVALERLVSYEVRAYHEYSISVTSQTSAGMGGTVMKSFLTPAGGTYAPD